MSKWVVQGRVYAPGDSEDKMAAAIKDFNQYVIEDERVEVIALPFRDGVNIVQRRYKVVHIDQACCDPAVPDFALHACFLILLPLQMLESGKV